METLTAPKQPKVLYTARLHTTGQIAKTVGIPQLRRQTFDIRIALPGSGHPGNQTPETIILPAGWSACFDGGYRHRRRANHTSPCLPTGPSMPKSIWPSTDPRLLPAGPRLKHTPARALDRNCRKFLSGSRTYHMSPIRRRFMENVDVEV